MALGRQLGAPRPAWRIGDDEVEAIVKARHSDPFAVLGPHAIPEGVVIRAFAPYAESMIATPETGGAITLASRGGGFFEGLYPAPAAGQQLPLRYRLKRPTPADHGNLRIPTHLPPVLGAMDDYLLVEGTHRSLYERLGAHPMQSTGVAGVHFAVWAPTPHASPSSATSTAGMDGCIRCASASIRGFGRSSPRMLAEGIAYKYEIIARDGRLLPLKADPVGFAGELRPSTASIVARTDNFVWTDADYLEQRGRREPWREPMTILEVHLGSWRRGDGDRFLTYDELAEQLIPYAVDMGFTHLELMPVTEHPLDASWGYQPIGPFAPTRALRRSSRVRALRRRAHAAGLGIILDWVPAHFPTDVHGLALFDGAPLYEHADPRRGFPSRLEYRDL